MNLVARYRLLLALSVALLSLGCSQPATTFQNTDITGASFGRDFSLNDPSGKVRRLSDFKGKVVVLFFGFTQCPDVCPTTLVELSQVMKQLGADADRVQVLFVTVDPERDTPELLAQYVPAFDPRFLGLTGSPEDIASVAREFRAFYQKVPTASTYTVDHFAGKYVFDTNGRLRLFMRYGATTDAITHDLRLLLRDPTT